MPVSIDTEYAQKEVLERKLRFLQEHPFEQLRLAKIEFIHAKEQWDEYLEDHERSAKIAKSITVFQSSRYKSSQTAFQQAAAKYEKLKSESDALGVSFTDTPEEVEVEIDKTNSRIEAYNIRTSLFKRLERDPGELKNVQQEIKKNDILTPPHRAGLLQEAREIAQNTELRILTEVEIPAYCYDKLKGSDFRDRHSLFESLYHRLNNLPVESKKLLEQYCQLEQRLFTEQELKCFAPENLGIPALECLKTEYIRLTALIAKRYGTREHLCSELIKQTTLYYEKSEKKLLRDQELLPFYHRFRLELSYGDLIKIKPEEREKRLKFLCGELGEDYEDVKIDIRSFYRETMRKIDLTLEYEKQILSDWDVESLKRLPEEEVENRLLGKLELISKIREENRDIKTYLHYKADEVGQCAILYHRMQHFPIHLWSLKTMSERKKYHLEFESALPLVTTRLELSRKLEILHRHTEAEIQLAKMEEALKALDKELLEVHLESQMDVPFQEAEIDFDKLGFRTKNRFVIACNKLREKHALILEENRFVRATVENLGALKHLSFEAQERAMPWIASKWFRVLRIQELLHMLGAEALPIDQTNNFSVGSCSYQLSPFQILLLKSYTSEALRLFQMHLGHDNWISRQIREELITVQGTRL